MSFIEYRNVTKSYLNCVSCADVSLSMKKNTSHAIVGENGAGKSTLVKLLGGIEPVTSGEIFINGNSYQPKNARDAFKNKIAFVHQHFLLASELTALDNLVLTATANQFALAFTPAQKTRTAAEALLKKFNWKIDLNKKVTDLSVGEQQRLEILKALLQNPEIIIFDEPTAVLTPQESKELLDFLIHLKATGKTIILISHKLNEIKYVSDYISIMHKGHLIETSEASLLDQEKIAEKMIGRKIIKENSRSFPYDQKATVLNIPNTKIALKKNEVFGVAGIEGNGQEQFIEFLLHEIKAMSLSFGDITEDRLKLSVFNNMNMEDHMLLKHFSSFTKNNFVTYEALSRETQNIVNKWDIRPPDSKKIISEMSGGNQQKFFVARELWHQPEILLAAHPTRGVDLGAQENIHKNLFSYAEQNKTVVIVSSDLDEVLYLSDRFIILNKGKVFGPFNKNELNEMQIGQYMLADTHEDLK